MGPGVCPTSLVVIRQARGVAGLCPRLSLLWRIQICRLSLLLLRLPGEAGKGAISTGLEGKQAMRVWCCSPADMAHGWGLCPISGHLMLNAQTFLAAAARIQESLLLGKCFPHWASHTLLLSPWAAYRKPGYLVLCQGTYKLGAAVSKWIVLQFGLVPQHLMPLWSWASLPMERNTPHMTGLLWSGFASELLLRWGADMAEWWGENGAEAALLLQVR